MVIEAATAFDGVYKMAVAATWLKLFFPSLKIRFIMMFVKSLLLFKQTVIKAVLYVECSLSVYSQEILFLLSTN